MRDSEKRESDVSAHLQGFSPMNKCRSFHFLSVTHHLLNKSDMYNQSLGDNEVF